MNNAINEIKNTLEATHSRITEAEDRISEFEDRMVEINESERINEKRIKSLELLRGSQDPRRAVCGTRGSRGPSPPRDVCALVA